MIRVALMLMVMAALLWLFFWALQRRSGRSGPQAPGRPRPAAPRGPDDDEDFLREIDRRRRRQQRERDADG